MKNAIPKKSRKMQNMMKFNVDGRNLFLTWFRKIQFEHIKHLNSTNFMV